MPNPPATVTIALRTRHPGDGWTLADPRPATRATRRALKGLVRALCASSPSSALPDFEDRVETHVRRMLQYMPKLVAVGFVLAVHVVDWSPVWRLRAMRRVHRLDREVAEGLLAEISESQSPILRTMLLGIRALVLSTFYDQEEVHRAMGWEPRAFISNRILLRRRLLSGGAPATEDFIEAPSPGAMP